MVAVGTRISRRPPRPSLLVSGSADNGSPARSTTIALIENEKFDGELFGALVQVAEHVNSLAQPTPGGGDLRGIATVLVVSIPAPARCTAAVCATVHPAPSPARDRGRLNYGDSAFN